MGAFRSNGMSRPTRVVAWAVLLFCGPSLVACGTSDSSTVNGPLSDPMVDAKVAEASGIGEADWASLGVPYGVLSTDRTRMFLAFGRYMVELPYEQASGPAEGPPAYELLSMTATSAAGIFELQPANREPEVWALTGAGEWLQLGTSVIGIPLADVTSSAAYWVERPVDALPTLKAFEVESNTLVGSAPLAQGGSISAVDGSRVFLSPTTLNQAALTWDSQTSKLESANSLGILKDELVTTYRTGVGGVLQSGGGGTRFVDERGSTLLELKESWFGQLSPSGAHVALTGTSPKSYALRTFPAGKTVPLSLPTGFNLAGFAWAQTGELIAEGTTDGSEDAVVAGEHSEAAPALPYLCEVSTGECRPLADRIGGIYGESSARGQIVATLPDDFVDEGE